MEYKARIYACTECKVEQTTRTTHTDHIRLFCQGDCREVFPTWTDKNPSTVHKFVRNA